jgi:acyl carrier protein
MSIQSTIISEIQQISRETKRDLPPLSNELVLRDSGLDSLAIAIVVTRLEDALGLDPFTESDDTPPPVTLGEFIAFYQNAAKLSDVDPGCAG